MIWLILSLLSAAAAAAIIIDDRDRTRPKPAPAPPAVRLARRDVLAVVVDVSDHGLTTARGVHLDLLDHETDWCLGDVLDLLADIENHGRQVRA